jgi:uncharacterized hydantoinase/oxoprolinase family protein
MRLLTPLLAAIVLCGAVRAQDPQTLPKQIKADSDRVAVSGRWVPTAALSAPFIPRANSVEIVCTKVTGTCHEAVAALYTRTDEPRLNAPFLLATLTEFKIRKWDASQIVAVAERPVADVTLDIGLTSGDVLLTHRETQARGSKTADPSVVFKFRLE